MGLVEQLQEYYQKLKQEYDKCGDQLCYMTKNGQECRPLDVWEKVMISLFLSDLNTEEQAGALQNVYQNSMRTAFIKNFEGKVLNKKNTLELIKYTALCYSKMNDKNAVEHIVDNKEIKYFSYGNRSNNILTPDERLDYEDKKSNRKCKQEELVYNDYRNAIEEAIKDPMNQCPGIIDAKNTFINDYQTGRDGKVSPDDCIRLISSVPLYLFSDSAICPDNKKKPSWKCNIYVGDVIFGVLSALVGLVDSDTKTRARKIHDFLKGRDGGRLVSSNGRMQTVTTFLSRCEEYFKQQVEKREEEISKGGKAVPLTLYTSIEKDYGFYRLSYNNEANDSSALGSVMMPFEFIAFLQTSSGFEHMTISADESKNDYKNFKHLSAHATLTNVADTETENLNEDKNCFYHSFWVNVELISLYDLIELLFFSYCKKYKVTI